MTTPPAPAVPPEYTAARHIFRAPALAGRLSPFIADADFDWAGIFTEARTMSTGQRLLIRAAHDLWTADRSVGISELARQLDGPGFTRVMQALRICRGEAGDPRPAPRQPPARRLRVVR